MSVETELETQPSPNSTDRSESAAETITPPSQRQRRVNPFLIGGIVFILLAAGIGWYIYAQGYEDTDDAQVDGHLNPIASRIDGTIKAVYVDDNQTVQAGAMLAELDPSDDQVALQQSQAQYDQAMAQLSASHPNLPITRLSNQNDLTSQQAEVVAAEATLAAAQHDYDSAVAKLKESQAVNERNQADFARYQTLFDKQEVARAD
jgi:membrane fusion protein, multidrug efflux system